MASAALDGFAFRAKSLRAVLAKLGSEPDASSFFSACSHGSICNDARIDRQRRNMDGLFENEIGGAKSHADREVSRQRAEPGQPLRAGIRVDLQGRLL